MEASKAITNPSLTLRERILVAQKTFRLIVANTLGLAVDAMTPAQAEDRGQEPGNLAQLGERAEIRGDAGAIHMTRYVLEREIGPEAFREEVERRFIDSAR